MGDMDCIHAMPTADCATCGTDTRTRLMSRADRVGHEKLLVFHPAIAEDSLLHCNRPGDSCDQRRFVGRLVEKAAWAQPDAAPRPSSCASTRPKRRIAFAPKQVSVERTDR
jgi:hypothetical protein